MSRPAADRENPALMVLGGLVFAAVTWACIWGFGVLGYALGAD